MVVKMCLTYNIFTTLELDQNQSTYVSGGFGLTLLRTNTYEYVREKSAILNMPILKRLVFQPY